MTNSHIHQSRYKVTLPDGTREDIRTKEGVDACLSEIDFIRQYVSNTLQDALSIREKQELDQEDKLCLMQAYTLMHCLSLNANKDIFKKVMLKSDIRIWFDLAIDEIKTLSTKPSWMLTGILNEFEEAVIHPCVTLILHPVPVTIAFESEFFQVFADFIRARKGSGGGLPSPKICTFIGSIMFWAWDACTQQFDHCWEPEKCFERLEASGILEQFLRCVTVPQFPESDTLMSTLLDTLATECQTLVWNKFQVGTPCGDTLRAIIDGKDGSKTERVVVMQRLRGILNMVDNMEPPQPFVAKLQCEYCGKSGTSMEFQQSLLYCSRCKVTPYCSKECQRSDWKNHKKTCVPPSKREQTPPASLEVGLNDFVQRNGGIIAFKIIETCERTGLTIDDMIIEVDFMPTAEGIIPAMQTPAGFKVAPLQDYIDRIENPNWISAIKDPVKSEAARSEVIGRSKEMQAEMKKSKAKKCMFLANFNGLACMEVQTKKQTFISNMLKAQFENFTKKNHQAIVKKVGEACNKHKVVMKDLVMELDFVPNKKGVVPASQTPPIFNVVLAKRYINKSRPKEKDWFFNHQHPEILPAMKKGAVQVVRGTPREAGDLLCLLHFYGGLADRIFSQANAMSLSAQ